MIVRALQRLLAAGVVDESKTLRVFIPAFIFLYFMIFPVGIFVKYL